MYIEAANLEMPSRAVVRFYKRGTAEQWIKEGRQKQLACLVIAFTLARRTSL
jgi:hypothetical protein